MSDDVKIDEQATIPAGELDFRFSRASGPGGQHVQKTATRVELLFDVGNSPSLTDAQRARILKRLASYIDSDGVLHLVSQSERSQWRNRQEVVNRFQDLLCQALRRRKHRRPTQPSAASREDRIRRKKRRSQTKKWRGPVERDW